MIQARNVTAADMDGTSDPYVKLHIENAARDTTEGECKTNHATSTLNPEWNETFAFGDVHPSSTLVIDVFDHDYIGDDDPIGGCTCSLLK